ncbi:MAG: asparagine synthase-related protein [Sulfobacillus sp.]
MCGIFFYFGDRSTESLSIHANRIRKRGPDRTTCHEVSTGPGSRRALFVFHRLAIVGQDGGNQPFVDRGLSLVCNGEIYNHAELQTGTNEGSDCSCLIPGMRRWGICELSKRLDSEHALVAYDAENQMVLVSRDHCGIRPLYFGSSVPFVFRTELPRENGSVSALEFDENGFPEEFGLASEAKALFGIFDYVEQFPPGHSLILDFRNRCAELARFVEVCPSQPPTGSPGGCESQPPTGSPLPFIKTRELATRTIREALISSVRKRYLMSERPVCCALSGGLDSFLVTYIAAKLSKEELGTPKFRESRRLATFSVGLSSAESPDLQAARIIAAALGTDHHEVTFTVERAIEDIVPAVETCETWCTTTIRAFIPMYEMGRAIADTGYKVVLSGEGSDELFMGYFENHALSERFAGRPQSEMLESALEVSRRRIRQIHFYDGKRADRALSCWGLETRVPFLSREVIEAAFSLDPALKVPALNGDIEKLILREAFFDFVTEPELSAFLMRPKEAFSDAVGENHKRALKRHAEDLVSDEEFKSMRASFESVPDTKEDYLYQKIHRELFGKCSGKLLPHGKWMPSWVSHEETGGDPSATVLKCYQKRIGRAR